MKGKIPKIVMLLVAVAMAMSLVAVATTAAETTLPPEDSWGGMPLPSLHDWNIAPGTDVGPLAMDDEGDGTLHIGVYDARDSAADANLGTRWGSPRGTVRWSVFYATDGGYDWKLGWELLEDDPGPILDIVQVPGYEHPGWVYFITPLFLYYSSNGGEDFQRAPKCPGVVDMGVLTSLDVAPVAQQCPTCDEYVAVVGVAGGNLDGVYTYNEEGVGLWYDKEITNFPAGTGPELPHPVYEVRFSPGYAEASPGDLGIWAVAYYDPSNIGSAFDAANTGYTAGKTTLVAWHDGISRSWSNQYLDAPLLTILDSSVGECNYAVLDYADDFDIDNSPLCWIGIAGTTPNDDVWMIKTLPPAKGPSSAYDQNISGMADQPIDSLAVFSASIATECLVGLRDMTSPVGSFTAQVVHGTGIYITPLPQWLRSIKNPAGSSGVNPNDAFNQGRVFVVEGTGGSAHCSTGYTGVPSGVSYNAVSNDIFSGVWRLAAFMGQNAWNGTGLLDDILVSSTYLDKEYINYAELVWEETSPDYNNDETIFFVSWSDWVEDWSLKSFEVGNCTLLWWRTTDNAAHWEMIYRQGTFMPVGMIMGMPDQWVDEYHNLEGDGPDAIWSVRTTPQFSMAGGGDMYVFLLGYSAAGGDWWIWNSLNGGDIITPVSAMPAYVGNNYMHLGWEVFDSNTFHIGDDYGLVYGTKNAANSWTDGVATHFEDACYITDIDYSPIYADEPGAGEDQAIIVGAYYYDYSVAEVWFSYDGCESDMTMVGTFPGYQYEWDDVSPVMVDFDNLWGTETSPECRTIYAAISGMLDNWEWVEMDAGEWMIYEWGDVGIYRTDVQMYDPVVSVWEPIYNWDQLQELLPPDPVLDIRSPDNTDDFWRYIWFTELEVGPHNTIYAPYTVFDDWWADSGEGRFTHGGVLRCLDGRVELPENTEWSNIILGLPHWTGLYLVDAVAGTTHLFSIGYRNDYWYSDLLDMRLMGYTDTLCQEGPEMVSPDDGETGVGDPAGELEKVNVILEWEDFDTSVTVTFQWQLDDDSLFDEHGDAVLEQGFTSMTLAEVVGLENAFDYFWRVRATEPAFSPWSGPNAFKTASTTLFTTGTGPSIADGSPSSGATNVPTKPTFSWGTIGGVDYYELEVATNANFSDLVIEEETEGTAYTPDADLDENTTYYWRVRGCTDDNECSDWSSTGVFTTGPEEVETAGTPAWVWVVIVIGAILAIAVIVLIVRTRRPV